MSHREEEALGEDPGHAGETMPLGWPGNASGSPGRAGGSVWGEGSLGISALLRLLPPIATRSQIKQLKMDGWMEMNDLHAPETLATVANYRVKSPTTVGSLVVSSGRLQLDMWQTEQADRQSVV
ncbi:hypothetical protein L3Q82_004372 [Scortum barcoo]|uniref:Uncharacterized protein n=1 Tax=Scortum barcoo TaxID=214431 RepID=A0ACB8VLN1_9TELE|nr:hypothetical protein L3Q82_004372 [Scortum barcoo]